MSERGREFTQPLTRLESSCLCCAQILCEKRFSDGRGRDEKENRESELLFANGEREREKEEEKVNGGNRE